MMEQQVAPAHVGPSRGRLRLPKKALAQAGQTLLQNNDRSDRQKAAG
jgi:hypothetical protein